MRFPAERASRISRTRTILALALAVFVLACPLFGRAQENPLGNINTPAPPPPSKPAEQKPADSTPGPTPATAALRTPSLHVDVNLVQVPATVTDPLNRLVTGLEKENFTLSDNNVPQTIQYFSSQDTPITIGLVVDLSGSMSSKFDRVRKALTEFLRTSNPQDEFFVVGFNDRPAIIVDYTSEVDDVEARMAMLKPENRTALIDAVYLGVEHLRQAKYERKALLILSDGGDNRSRYTQNELQRVVREADIQIYSIGIFDNYAGSTEEQLGPELLKGICEMTGGRLFTVSNVTELPDIAARISAELRNQYVLGYSPSVVKRDGNWRKLKVKLTPPPGLPTLTVHFREGYYAPSE